MCGAAAPGPVWEEVLQRNFAESRKRIGIMFRMVHLSSEIPGELQGRLAALSSRFFGATRGGQGM